MSFMVAFCKGIQKRKNRKLEAKIYSVSTNFDFLSCWEFLTAKRLETFEAICKEFRTLLIQANIEYWIQVKPEVDYTIMAFIVCFVKYKKNMKS